MPAAKAEHARVLPLVATPAAPVAAGRCQSCGQRLRPVDECSCAYEIGFKDGRAPVFRIIVARPGSKPRTLNFPTKDLARRARAKAEATLQQHSRLTTRKAIDLYMAAHVAPSGSKGNSNTTKKGRLLALFEPSLDLPVMRLVQEGRGRALYLGKVAADIGPDGKPRLLEPGYIHRPTKKTGKPPAVDTHQNTLKVGQAFTAWLVQEGFLPIDPLKDVKPVGSRRDGGFGKSSLTFEEILRLDRTCEDVLAKLEAMPAEKQLPWRQRCVAVIMALRMGARTNELLSTRRRQIAITRKGAEVGGTWEVVRESAKTGTSVRRLPIPPNVMRHLLPLLEGKGLEQYVLAGAPRGDGGGLGGRNWERDPNYPLTERWLANSLERLCKRAGIRVENPHGLRGAFKDLTMVGGAAIAAAQQALGHGGERVGQRHYANEDIAAQAEQKRMLEQLGHATDSSEEGVN